MRYPKLIKITTDGVTKEFTVSSSASCQSRGHEFLLNGEAGMNCRVCHNPRQEKNCKVFTSGSLHEYIY